MKRYLLTYAVTIVMMLIALPAFGAEADEQDYSSDMMNYYLNPKPKKLAEWLQAVAIEPTPEGQDDTIPAFFFGEALRRNPEQCANIKKVILETDAEAIQRLGILSLWVANVEASREALTAICKQTNDTALVDAVNSLLQQEPREAIRTPIVNAADLDRLWMVFAATGDIQTVQRIMSIGRYNPDKVLGKVSMDNFLLIKVARWSLFSVAKNNALVDEALQREETLRLPGDFGNPDGLPH
ncbi:hypothetical protein [Pseudodesulfovibrio sp.]|uniref:hypothetical protein n=1 Tax=unclassified Pseudodesulfovibrio TaxID=2661612 RepID=UPI003B00D52F